MTYGDADYKTWLSGLKVGSKVILAGKDCPDKERGEVRTINEVDVDGDFYVACHWPLKNPGSISEHAFNRIDGILWIGGWDFYVMPVERSINEIVSAAAKEVESWPAHKKGAIKGFKTKSDRLIHKLEPTHNRDAAYIKGMPGHGTQAAEVLRIISTRSPIMGVCMHRIKQVTKYIKADGWENSTISARLNRLQGGKNLTEFPVLIKPAKKQRQCIYCKGKSNIVPTHYVVAK